MPEPPSFPKIAAALSAVIPTGAGPEATGAETTLEEERREIVASVLAALAGNTPDPDEMAACSRLLKHLAQTADCRLQPYPPRLTL